MDVRINLGALYGVCTDSLHVIYRVYLRPFCKCTNWRPNKRFDNFIYIFQQAIDPLHQMSRQCIRYLVNSVKFLIIWRRGNSELL